MTNLLAPPICLRSPCVLAEGNNINLKLHRLRQDIFDHLQSAHQSHGHEEDKDHHPPAPGSLILTFDQFYDYFWGQFTVWEHGAEAWSEDKEKESAMRKFVLLVRGA